MNYQTRPVRVTAVLWNGGMGQEGVAPGRESYVWHGHELWDETHHMITDEFGKRLVLTKKELDRRYEPI